MSTNWIEEGRLALANYREKSSIDQTDTDALAAFVEQALVKTTWNGEPEPLTSEEWVVRFDGAVRPYPTHEEAIAECERITRDDIPRMKESGWPTAAPTITHEMRSRLRMSIEASEVLEREVFGSKKQAAGRSPR